MLRNIKTPIVCETIFFSTSCIEKYATTKIVEGSDKAIPKICNHFVFVGLSFSGYSSFI